MINESTSCERLGSDTRTQDSNTTQEPVERCLHPFCSALEECHDERPIPEGYRPCCLEEEGDRPVWDFIWKHCPSDDMLIKVA